MTLKEWDARYGEAAQLKQSARFRRPAIAFGVLLVGTIGAGFFTHSIAGRSWVSAVGMIAFLGFVFSTAISLMPWILSFVDRAEGRQTGDITSYEEAEEVAAGRAARKLNSFSGALRRD